MWRSVRQTPQARTASRIWPGPGSGSVSSVSRSGWPARLRTIARIGSGGEVAAVEQPGTKRGQGARGDGDAAERDRFDSLFDRVSVVLEDRGVAQPVEARIELADQVCHVHRHQYPRDG